MLMLVQASGIPTHKLRPQAKESAMPPKGSTTAKSTRYARVVTDLMAQRQAAKKLLTNLRKEKRLEDRRHRRLMKSASKLDARDLMELAGIKNVTMGTLASFIQETGVDCTDFPIPEPAPEGASSASRPVAEERVASSKGGSIEVPNAVGLELEEVLGLDAETRRELKADKAS
jgi:hypothetical protein